MIWATASTLSALFVSVIGIGLWVIALSGKPETGQIPS